MEKESIKFFVESLDGIRIKNNHFKLVYIVLILFPMATLLSVVSKKISYWFLVPSAIIYGILCLTIFVGHFAIKQEQARYYFKEGMIGVGVSILSIYSELVFSYTNNIIFLSIYYISIWLLQSIFVVEGVLYNIRLNKYKDSPKWKYMPFQFNCLTIIIIVFSVATFIFPILMMGIQLFNPILIFDSSQISLISSFLLVEIFSVFAWKILLKSFFLIKYKSL
jgi:membrane protein